MKKNKTVEEYRRMQTSDGLIELCREALAKAEEKALKLEAENKEKISELTVKENGLKEKIKAGEQVLEKMRVEFEALERKQAARNLTEVEKSALTKQDVLDGKITISQYQANGKELETIKQKATIQTIEALKLSSDAIRAKATELIRDEIELYDIQIMVHNLMLNPVKSLRYSLEQRIDILNHMSAPLAESFTTAHSLKIERSNDLLLIEKGTSMSGGKTWDDISLKEARNIICDPTFPEEHIFFLLQQLSEIEEDEATRLTIVFRSPGSHWPGHPITIRVEE